MMIVLARLARDLTNTPEGTLAILKAHFRYGTDSEGLRLILKNRQRLKTGVREDYPDNRYDACSISITH